MLGPQLLELFGGGLGGNLDGKSVSLQAGLQSSRRPVLCHSLLYLCRAMSSRLWLPRLPTATPPQHDRDGSFPLWNRKPQRNKLCSMSYLAHGVYHTVENS